MQVRKVRNGICQFQSNTCLAQRTRHFKNIPKRLIVTALLGMGVPLIHATRTNVGTLAEMMLDERSIETDDVKLNVRLV